MAELSIADMAKVASSGKYSGQKRDDIFSLKIKDKSPFIVGANAQGKSVTGISYDTKTRMLTYLDATKKIQQVSFRRIFKDPDFGGGSGSGGGATDTAYTESLQCYYCAYVFNVAKKKVTSVSNEDLKESQTWAHTDKSLADCLKNGPKDWQENDVYIKTANKIFEKITFKTTPVYFHRGSPFMTNVYKAKASAHAKDRQSGSPQAPGSFSHDKWNPGDIWASTFSVTSKPSENFTDSWGILNAEVLRLAGNASMRNVELLGISLKKVTTENASLVEYSTPAQMAQRQSYTWDGFKYGRTGDFFNSNDIYITISGKEVQLRTFGSGVGGDQWQGEIKAASAAGGKIGGGNIDFFCQKIFGKSVYGTKSGESSFITEAKSPAFKYSDKLYEMYKSNRAGGSLAKPELVIQNLMQH